MASINIHRIKIMLTTNISGSKPFPLTYNTFYEKPDKQMNGENSDEREPDDSKDESRNESFPYFTYDCEINSEKIKELPKEQRILCFFNKTLFSNILNTSLMATTPEDKHAKGNKNMNIMLHTLFRTSFPTIDNISDTYNTLILQTNKNMGIGDTSSFSFLKSTPSNFSYITVQEVVYTITRVTWLNDLINDPEFGLLFRRISSLNKWLKNEIVKIKGKIQSERSRFNNLQNDFVQKVLAMPSSFDIDIQKDLTQISRWISSYKSQIGITSQQMKDAVNTLLAIIKHPKPDLYASITKLYDLNMLKPSRVYSTEIIPLTLLKIRPFKDLLQIIENVNIYSDTIEYFETPAKYLVLMNLNKEKQMSKHQDQLFSHLNKYKEFTSIFQLVKPYTSKQIIVTNPVLQNIFTDIDEFLKLTSYVSSLQNMDESNESEYTNIKALEIGIVKKGEKPSESTDENKQKNQNIFEIKSKQEYQVYVALDLVNGILTSENVNQIKCQYKDFRASSLYKDLRENSKKNKSIIYIPEDMPNIKSLQKASIKGSLKKGGFQVNTPKKGDEHKAEKHEKKKPRNKTRRRKTSQPKESPNKFVL